MNSQQESKKGRPSNYCSGDAKLRGSKFKIVRRFLHKTQVEMAEILRISPDQVSKQERAVKGREIDDPKINEFAKKLSLDPQLFDDSVDLESFECRIAMPNDSIYSGIPNNIPRIDYEFIGRKKEIKFLLQNLCPESRSYIISITGVGGVGKSSLAIEVAKKCIEKGYFNSVVWKSAKEELLVDNEVKRIGFVKSNLEGLLTKIIEVLEPDLTKNLPCQEQQLLVTRRLLAKTKTLLIVDNMETVDDDQVRLFIDEAPSPSKVLVTDRRSVQTSKAIQLLELTEDESVEIINEQCRIYNLQIDNQQKISLAKMTCGIPLAIKWAIGQIASKHWEPEMLAMHLDENKDIPILDFLFKKSFNQFSTHSKKIISSLAVLPVPMTGIALSEYNNIPENDTKDALSQLLQYAFISKNENLNITVPSSYFIPMLDRRYRVLPLTKKFISKQNEFTNIKLSKSIIVKLHGQLTSFKDNFNWPSTKLIEFVDANKEIFAWAIEEAYRIGEYELVTNIMKYIGYPLGIRGKHNIRLKLGEMAVEAAKIICDNIEQSRNLIWNIGWVYFGWYQFEKCEKYIKEGIKNPSPKGTVLK